MSAWVVTKAHIDVLVNGLVQYQLAPVDPAALNKIGAMLWRENHKSVNYRYSQRKRTPAYRFEGVEAPLRDDCLLDAFACFDYQSCEHDGWLKSESFALLNRLRDAILMKHGVEDLSPDCEAEETLKDKLGKGLPKPPWGFDSIAQALYPSPVEAPEWSAS